MFYGNMQRLPAYWVDINRSVHFSTETTYRRYLITRRAFRQPSIYREVFNADKQRPRIPVVLNTSILDPSIAQTATTIPQPTHHVTLDIHSSDLLI